MLCWLWDSQGSCTPYGPHLQARLSCHPKIAHCFFCAPAAMFHSQAHPPDLFPTAPQPFPLSCQPFTSLPPPSPTCNPLPPPPFLFIQVTPTLRTYPTGSPLPRELSTARHNMALVLVRSWESPGAVLQTLGLRVAPIAPWLRTPQLTHLPLSTSSQPAWVWGPWAGDQLRTPRKGGRSSTASWWA